MANEGQHYVKTFLERIGLQVNPIKETTIKTPDFEVLQNGQLVCYCEEKTLEENETEYLTAEELEEYCDGIQAGIEVNIDKDSTYNSISTHIHKAIKQFNSVNPHREFPNVLAITNFNSSRDIHDLFITLTGKALLDDGSYMRIHRVGRIRSEINNIDLFLWFDKADYKGCIWGEFITSHDITLKRILKDYVKTI